jgi:hypothetical protein
MFFGRNKPSEAAWDIDSRMREKYELFMAAMRCMFMFFFFAWYV